MPGDTGKLPPELARLRARLDEIDRDILRLVAERQQTVAEIGELKHGQQRALRDFAREREVIERGIVRGRELGLPDKLSRELLERLIHHSLASQESQQLQRAGQQQGRRALVLGGAGRMGQWFARFLDAQGCQVEIADPSAQASAFPRVDDWQAAAQDADLVVLAAPLRQCNTLMLELACLRPAGLIFDIGSLKSPLKSGLEALRDAGCRVTSIHPMFGPDTRMLSGHHVLLVDAGHRPALEQARELFASTMAECVELSLAEHDETMAWVLGLSHLANIGFAATVARHGEHLPLLRSLASPTFANQLGIAGQVVSENPRLYFEIQHLNDQGQQPARSFHAMLATLLQQVEAGDEAAFTELMTQARESLARELEA